MWSMKSADLTVRWSFCHGDNSMVTAWPDSPSALQKVGVAGLRRSFKHSYYQTGWYQGSLCRKRSPYYKYLSWSLYYMGLSYVFLMYYGLFYVRSPLYYTGLSYLLRSLLCTKSPILYGSFVCTITYGSLLCTKFPILYGSFFMYEVPHQ